MKKQIVSTVLFTLLVTLPGYADCPLGSADKSNNRSAKRPPAVASHSYATPEPTVPWHDLHWFE